ncbi:MAG TPA: hypothetical protein VFL91_13490 [Thermomicrobiales bacterium]|nr:hypothetical protein [Thermomicrobiales bacterium]
MAVGTLDGAGGRDEVAGARAEVEERFGRLLAFLYGGGRLPGDAEVRAALAACGTGAAQLAPLAWARARFVHQFWTREFVDALAAFLGGLAAGPLLEVGAGRGELSRWLRGRGVPIVATDDGSWLDGRLDWPRGLADDVLLFGYEAALARYRPAVVVCSWMPLGEDWTPAFRACPSVRHYLLIGEGPGGCTGTPASFAAPPPWRGESLRDLARHGLTRNADRAYSTSVYWFARGA